MSRPISRKLVEELDYFLKSFTDKAGNLKYRNRIAQMVATGAKSLIIDYDDLLQYDAEIAQELLLNPDEVLADLDRALYDALRAENASYAEIVRKELRSRIRHLPEVLGLRSVSTAHLNRMVAVTGMVIRASELKPQAIELAYRCRNGHLTRVKQSGMVLKAPARCDECGEGKGLEIDQRESAFIDYQVLRLQEMPEELPPGQLPQYFDVDLTGDMVNVARPGDRVILTGIVRADPEVSQSRSRSRVFRSRIEGNFVEVMGKEPEQIQLSKEDEELIKGIAKQPNAYERLIRSIAPAIQGYEKQKEALLLMTVGAPRHVLEDGTTLRGDINVLLVGDPGTAKSELLKYAARIAPRGLYTSGRGSTAAGLTAAVVREKSGMMTLEAGAVVLADQGVASIDEFDKMRTEDRNALHECMEQQTVSVAKGGIVATLNARTSILAASNPVLGKYDPYRNITENVNLPIPLLTRFDLIFVMRDVPDRKSDEELATHVLEMHRRGAYVIEPPIDYITLRKYLIYAKRINPKLTDRAMERLKEYYLHLRSLSSENMISVTPRQLESLIRLASARARVMLRDEVNEEDALRAISLMQYMLETVGVDVRTGKVDLGVLHGKPLSERNLLETALDVFKSLEGPTKRPVEGKAFIEELVKTGKFTEEEARRMLNALHRSGQIYEVRQGFYKKL